MVNVVPTVHNAIFRAKQFTETEKRFFGGPKKASCPPPQKKLNGDEIYPHLLIQNFLDPLLSFLINFHDI